MKNEVKRLKQKALNGLLLCIEHFNRPSDTGREDVVLILIGHACEMLIKAGILHRGGNIRKVAGKETIGFDSCVNKALTGETIKFLSESHAAKLRIIGGLRNSAQHYYRNIPEGLLYICIYDGVEIFRHVFHVVFKENIQDIMPARVLPISTIAPKDIIALFSEESATVKEMINSKSRQKSDALARLRNFDIVENALTGKQEFLSDHALKKICGEIGSGSDWTKKFPSIASLQVSPDARQVVQLRWSKKEGTPVRLAKEGEEPEASIVVQHRSKFETHPLGLRPLASKLGISEFRALALIHHLKIQDNREYYDIEYTPGKKMKFKLYSLAAYEIMKEFAANAEWDEIIDKYRNHRKKQKQRRAK